MTLQEPLRIQPSCCAAPRERSSCLPFMKGPLSLIRTIAVLLPCVKCSVVPNGILLCAAVSPFGLNRSPFAVLLPCIYQDAFIVFVAASTLVVAHPARTGTTRHTEKTRNIIYPFLVLPTGNDPVSSPYQSDILPLNYSSNGDQGRTRTLNLRVRSAML